MRTTSTPQLVAEPEADTPQASGSALCDARAFDCRCGLAADHGPFSTHQCGVTGCFASWLGDTTKQTFRPVTLPTWPPMPIVNKIIPRLRLVS